MLFQIPAGDLNLIALFAFKERREQHDVGIGSCFNWAGWFGSRT